MHTFKKVQSYLLLGVLCAPSVLLAQASGGNFASRASTIQRGNSFAGLVDTILSFLGAIVPLIFALAILYFLWGVLEYVTKAGEERQEATERIVGGLVALFVMFSVYGLISVIQGTVQLDPRKIESVQL